jgi:hypothetical protein
MAPYSRRRWVYVDIKGQLVFHHFLDGLMFFYTIKERMNDLSTVLMDLSSEAGNAGTGLKILSVTLSLM